MTNEQKAQKYNQLMYEYTQIQNKISSIKSESFELNELQTKEVKILESKLKEIMYRASIL